MLKKIEKKLGSMILILMIALQMMLGSSWMVLGNQEEEITVIGYKITDSDKTVITEVEIDDNFYLKELKLFNGVPSKINIKQVAIGTSSAFVSYSGAVEVEEEKQIDTNETATISLKGNGIAISYKEKDNKLPLIIMYEEEGKAGTKSVTTSFYINTKDTDSSGGSVGTPITPKANPQLKTTKIPEGNAGDVIQLQFQVENYGNTTAHNLQITPILEGDNLKNFELMDSVMTKTIDRLSVKGSSTLSYKVKVLETVKAGTYPITFRVQYAENAYSNKVETKDEVIYVRVRNDNAPARLQLLDILSTPQVIKPGEKVEVGLNLENIGGLTAKQLKVAIEGLKPDGFILQDNSPIRYLKDLEKGKKLYMTYVLKASDQMVGGTQELTVKISYHNGMEAIEEEHKVFIPVLKQNQYQALLNVENMSAPKGIVRAGQDFSFGFDVRNLGSKEAHNVKVSVAQGDGGKEILPKSASVRMLPKMQGASKQSLNFVMTTSSQAASQNYPIEITVEYEEEVGGERQQRSFKQYIGVYVNNPKKDEEEDGHKTVPKIIIDEYSLDPGIVKAGQNFNLTTTFLNTNAEKAVKNIKISLIVTETSEKTGTVFTPVQSSNTFYIDQIAPKQRETKEITLYTIPDAKAKTYTITVKFEYEDDKGEALVAEDLIGIPVVQPSRLELGEIQFQGEPTVGEPLGLYLELYNTGKVTLNNLMVRLESDDFEVKDPNLFIGNFQEGATEYYDRAMIIPRQAGQGRGKLIFTYEDPTGEQLVKEEEFTIEAMEMFVPPMDDMDLPPQEMEKPSLMKRIFTNKYLWMGLILAGFITAGLIVRKRRKVQKGLDLDE